MKKLILSASFMLFVGLVGFAQDGTANKKCDKKDCSKDMQCGKKCDPKDCTPDMKCNSGKEKSCKKSCTASTADKKKDATKEAK